MRIFILCLLGVAISGCIKGIGSSTSGSSVAVMQASLKGSQITFTGNSLDEITSVQVQQAGGLNQALNIVSQTSGQLVAGFSSDASVKAGVPLTATLSAGASALSVNLVVDFNGTNVTGFKSTGITDLATSTTLTVSASNYVGIGTVSPGSLLTVSANSSTNIPAPPAGTVLRVAGTDNVGARLTVDAFGLIPSTLILRSAKGTGGAQAGLSKNNSLGEIGFAGYATTGYSTLNRADIAAIADENWTDTSQGTALTFMTTANSTTFALERMRINPAGNVGIGTSSPSALLDVAGHLGNSGGAASVSACGGGSPTITGNDTRGIVTTGTGTVNSCNVTFATSFSTAPYCVVSWSGGVSAVGLGTSTTTTVLTVSFSASSPSSSFVYQCMQ